MYTPLRPSQHFTLPIRSYTYHVRHWGTPHGSAPPLVLLHGWMDVGASWQFVMDALSDAFLTGREVIAPDWRGFGHSRGPACDSFHFVDYLADLDLLLEKHVGDRPIDLVGHSMGGNVAMHYGGVRPARVRRLVNLEGFGMPAFRPDEAPGRYARWIDELKKLHRGEMALSRYAGPEGVARRLMKTNPRLAPDKAEWLARHWAREVRPVDGGDGQARWEILGDAAHKVVNANLFRVEEMLALYAAITAPVLAVEASENSLGGWWGQRYGLDEYHARLKSVRDVRVARVDDAGHMLHHDQPERIATLIEDFLGH